jgi:hypothetical protein
LPSAAVHTRPGPGHDTGDDPSPASNTSCTGRAVTVADSPAADAVADNVRHVSGAVKKNVHKFTYVNGRPSYDKLVDGVRPPDGLGNLIDRYARCANDAGVTTGGHPCA